MSTKYAVQSFRLKGLSLVADQLQSALSEEAAIVTAERMSMTRDGVIAFSQEVDVETDCYDEPIVLYRHGTLPPELMD